MGGKSALGRFISTESVGGVLLAAASIAALVLANSPWRSAYEAFLATPGELSVGSSGLAKPLVVWVNDLWMAVFFLTVGLEIKRELMVGRLASPRQALLPVVAAVGGMAVPSLIYTAFNHADPVGLRGWAIPAATDIAFALGILALLGSRAPASLKVFLTAVAIIDDLGAILIIALFYSSQLSLPMLGCAGAGCAALLLLNRCRVGAVLPYLAVGLVTWFFVLKSGVHPTLAGVVTAFAIPMRRADGRSPAEEVQHALHPWVACLVLPVFAFANAGVSLQGLSLSELTHPVPLGIAAGLVVGKAVGVFGATWVAVQLGASFPAGANRVQFFGMSLLCGIGFTMSLFIGGLAFAGQEPRHDTLLKLGVLGGSAVSALLGMLVLWRAERRSGPRRYQ
jgi:NhaA family Na+:H+ antiporter